MRERSTGLRNRAARARGTYIDAEASSVRQRSGEVERTRARRRELQRAVLKMPVDTEDFLLTVAEVLTNPSGALSPPMDKQQFLDGYRRRLEVKLGHKNAQIVRNERLLQTLPDSLKGSFEDMLQDNYAQRDQIKWELDESYARLEKSLNED